MKEFKPLGVAMEKKAGKVNPCLKGCLGINTPSKVKL